MKKSLLALAVLGALSSAAVAQNVTVYGVADVGIERLDQNTVRWGMESGQQSGSRIGFRGTEDLGGGLTAMFGLETGFNVDTGAQQGNLFTRHSYVGVKGSFGAVKLGNLETPMRAAHLAVDPFGLGLAGNMETVFNQYGDNTGFNGNLVRMRDAVSYSITRGALSSEVAYGFGETAGKLSNRQLGLNVGYGVGPAKAVFGYHGVKNGTTDSSALFVGGTYDLKVVKAHLGFGESETEVGATKTLKDRDLMLGVSAPVKSGTVLASYLKKDDRLTGANDGDLFAIGYTHDLSKRTNLYTSWGKYDAKAAGGDANILNMGVRHAF